MPKVLTVTPNEGESTEEFAQRVSGQVSEFFGSDAGASSPSDQPVDSGTGDGYDSTDVSADGGDQAQEAPSEG